MNPRCTPGLLAHASCKGVRYYGTLSTVYTPRRRHEVGVAASRLLVYFSNHYSTTTFLSLLSCAQDALKAHKLRSFMDSLNISTQDVWTLFMLLCHTSCRQRLLCIVGCSHGQSGLYVSERMASDSGLGILDQESTARCGALSA